MEIIKTLVKQVKQYKKVTIITPIFTALEVLMEITIPFIMAEIIDKGIQSGNMGQVVFYGSLMLGAAFLSLFFGVMAGKFAASASTGFAANVRDAIFENVQTFSFSNIDKFSTAGLVTRMTTDITNVQMAFQMCLRIVVRAPLMMICSVVMCILISPSLSMIFFVAMIFLGISLSIIISKATKIFNAVFEKYDALNESVQENVSGIRVVKAYVREKYETSKFHKASDNIYKMFVKAEKILAFNNPVMMLAVYGSMLSLSWLGAKNIVLGDLTTGELTSMFSYVMSILMSLMMVSMIFVMMSMSVASMRRITEVINEKPDIHSPENPVMEVKDGQIDFDHVDFAYKHGSGELVLKDIDLHIKSGETIGVIGGTGSGKSSLVNLISRLYDVDKGSVMVGGVNVKDYDMELLRNEVAVVLQKNVLFSGTILDNLRWGKEDATLEECQKACEAAGASEFIAKFPDGYNTWIEQGGTNVSGGQKQRLCIARALLKRPKILILDDSTSAVDTATDARIRKALKEYIPGTTKIIIAQRVNSVMDADRIVVLDEGRVNGFDTHENLLENNAIYAEIYEAQTSGGGDFDEGGED